jgi:hypothetical protein
MLDIIDLLCPSLFYMRPIMEVGSLYKIARFKWMLPHSTRKFWSNCGPVVYLGESILVRDDGQRVVNHLLFADGEQRLVDKTFLDFLEPIEGEH